MHLALRLAGGGSRGPRAIWGARGSHEGNGTFLVHYTEQGFGKEQVLWTGDSSVCRSEAEKSMGAGCGEAESSNSYEMSCWVVALSQKAQVGCGLPRLQDTCYSPSSSDHLRTAFPILLISSCPIFSPVAKSWCESGNQFVTD